MTASISNSLTIASLPAISGTVTVGGFSGNAVTTGYTFNGNAVSSVPVIVMENYNGSIGTVDVSGGFITVTTGTNQIGVVTIGGGTVTLGASTSQIGSVTANISGTVPISITSVTIGSCVTHGVTIANTVVTFYPAQGTTVSNTNFTSITSSTSLVAADSGREVLTVFNEGAGNLHISPGATCTTISYQVRLSAGDYWECPAGQLSLAHTAVFATAGTARVCQVS